MVVVLIFNILRIFIPVIIYIVILRSNRKRFEENNSTSKFNCCKFNQFGFCPIKYNQNAINLLKS